MNAEISTMRELIVRLLNNYTTLFSKNGVLNSEGRKILEEVIKVIMNNYPFYRRLVYRVRREPTLDNILKLARIFMSEEEITELTNNIHSFNLHLN